MLAQHFAEKFERVILTHVRRDDWKLAFFYEVLYSLTPFSERKWPLRARELVLSCGLWSHMLLMVLILLGSILGLSVFEFANSPPKLKLPCLPMCSSLDLSLPPLPKAQSSCPLSLSLSLSLSSNFVVFATTLIA